MKVRHATRDEIIQAANANKLWAKVHYNSPKLSQDEVFVNLMLHRDDPDFNKDRFYKKNGKRIPIHQPACWHKHRDFIRSLFEIVPHAIVSTTIATYRSPSHFEAIYRNTKDSKDVCYCGDPE